MLFLRLQVLHSSYSLQSSFPRICLLLLPFSRSAAPLSGHLPPALSVGAFLSFPGCPLIPQFPSFAFHSVLTPHVTLSMTILPVSAHSSVLSYLLGTLRLLLCCLINHPLSNICSSAYAFHASYAYLSSRIVSRELYSEYQNTSSLIPFIIT